MKKFVMWLVGRFFHKKPISVPGMEFGIIDGKRGEIDE